MSYAQWNPATTYVQNDIVSYLGSLFVSLQTPNLNQNPSTATTYWAVSGGVGGVTKITAGTGVTITPTGGIGNVTINATGGGVASVSAGTGITLSGTPTAPVVNNAGVLGVTASGAGIAVSGTAQNPSVQNTGVTSLVAGSNITLSATTGAVTISAAAAPPASVPKSSTMVFGGSIGGWPNIPPSGTGYRSIVWGTALANDLQNGVSDANGTWVVFVSGYNLLMTGNAGSDTVAVSLTNGTDPGSFALNNFASGVLQSYVPNNFRIFSCPSIAIPVNAARTALPNLWVSARLTFTNNAASDTLSEQSYPGVCYAQYFPNGVQ
jgi:hypothetical protein